MKKEKGVAKKNNAAGNMQLGIFFFFLFSAEFFAHSEPVRDFSVTEKLQHFSCPEHGASRQNGVAISYGAGVWGTG